MRSPGASEEPSVEPFPAVHLAASLGGHLELLVRLSPHLEGYRPVWVTAAGAGADKVRWLGDRIVDIPRFNRSKPMTVLRNAWRSLRAAVREKPDVIVTSGAGSVVAFCVFGRLLGARVIFVETMARVTSPSASGRLLSRIARLVLVQWPEMADVYPNAVVCRPALWDDVGRVGGDPTRFTASRRGGTLVAVGTHRHQFNRLLEMVDRAVEGGVLPGPVVAQTGHSTYRPKSFRERPFLTTDELANAVAESDYVVTHGGAGIISAALRAGHRPLVLPRLSSFQEHVDDHQTQIVDKLSSLGLVVPIGEEVRRQDVLVAGAQAVSRPEDLEASPAVDDALIAELHRLVPTPAA